jgi:hypothetical protein
MSEAVLGTSLTGPIRFHLGLAGLHQNHHACAKV